MKAKRIVSILLTGSMLLSLLPVSALAATPVFDAPAQTTAKKAAPLVQEADASRSTEEEAATRSSRDLDAENGTAESITIQLNADGTPAGSGDDTHWYYSAASGCWLYNGVFALQPSSEAEAESALQATLYIKDAEFNSGTVGRRAYNEGTISDGTFQREVYNRGTISNGTFQWEVENDGTISNGTFQREAYNWGTISDGTFLGEVTNDSSYDDAASKYIPGVISGGVFQGNVNNHGNISDGTFQGEVYNVRGTISGGTFREAVEVYASSRREATIEGGTFEKSMTLMNDDASITISDGLFDGEVFTERCYSPLSISGGLFTKAVDVSNINAGKLSITGGYFASEPTLPEGSDTTFATVSDLNYRAFRVPVNGDFSENSYTSLYVPSGSSEQPNTITVKTDTALIDCRADGVSIMGTDKVQLNNDGSYTIEVYQPTSIVLVTAPPTPDEPGEPDPDFSSGTTALSVVLATAGFGSGATYLIGTNLWLNAIYDFVPTNRIQLAVALWNKADCPAPVSTELYPDIDADDADAQAAARWCVEQGLMKDYHETDKDGNEEVTFKPYRYMFRPQAIKAWYDLEKLLNEQQ